MRVTIHRHIVELAGSGLVLVGFLIAAMAVSVVPVLVQELTRRPATAGSAGGSGPAGPTFSGSSASS